MKLKAGSPKTLTDALSWAAVALDAVRVAVLLRFVGAAGALTTTETEPDVPAVMSPRFQVTLPPAKLPPFVELT